MTLISLHIIQNHAPSNLNRDDNGDPKDTVFGNARRARISSQSLKRSIRWNEGFRAVFDDPFLFAQRTKLLPELIKERLKQEDYNHLDDNTKERIIRQTERIGTNNEKKETSEEENDKRVTQQLMFLTDEEIETLLEELCKLCDKKIKRNKKEILFGDWTGDEVRKQIPFAFEPHAVDIAMFGRMTTSSPFKDMQASVQVAHAISTHKVDAEFDFFTAVDDVSGKTGAGMLGDVAFNSATYYKYINIHWEGLLKNLRYDYELAKTVIVAFLNAALTATPKGKQNTFAAHNLPDFALVEVLDKNIPVSYANAFITPVQAKGDQSLVQRSVEELLKYAQKIGTKYELASQQAMFSLVDELNTQIHDCNTISDLSDWLRENLPATEA